MISPHKLIETAGDFEDYTLDIFVDFIQSLIEEGGYTRPMEEDDGFDPDECGDSFVVYTDRGQSLILRMRYRLLKVGEKHFPNSDISLETSMYQEP